MSIKIGILMTTLNAGGSNMINSLKKFNWDYTILGLGKKWTGWRMRMEAYRDFAKDCNEDDIVVFIDGYDALAVRDSTGFRELYESFHANIVSGAEMVCLLNCLPIDAFLESHPEIPKTENKYSQAGCVMGKKLALQTLFQWMLDNNMSDDQIGLSTYINNQPLASISIDSEHKLVYNNNDMDNNRKILHDQGTISIAKFETISYPYFIHFPGFLLKRHLWQLFNPMKILNLPDYDFVGKHILQTDFIEIGQIEQVGYCINNCVTIIFLVLLILIVLIFGFIIWRKSRTSTPVKIHTDTN